jgi:hypothetical protein
MPISRPLAHTGAPDIPSHGGVLARFGIWARRHIHRERKPASLGIRQGGDAADGIIQLAQQHPGPGRSRAQLEARAADRRHRHGRPRLPVQPPEQNRLAERIVRWPADRQQRQIRSRDRQHPPDLDGDTRL